MSLKSLRIKGKYGEAVLIVIVLGVSVVMGSMLTGVRLPSLATVGGEFIFTAFGDSGFGGTGSDTSNNFEKAGSVGADFHLQLGDLSYGQTTEQNWCNTFKQSQSNVFVVTGNHDYGESGGGDMDQYKIYCPFTFTGLNSGSGVSGSGYGFEYYFDYPTASPIARIIMTCAGVKLVNNGAGSCLYTPGSTRANWLSNAIDQAHNSGLWVIVGAHKEYVSTGPYGGDTGKEYFDLLLQKKVDLILMGHDHTYQRSKLLSCCFDESTTFDPSKVLESGPTYTRGLGSLNIIAGTGGWGLYTITTSDPDNSYFATWNGNNIGNSYGTLKVTVSPTSLSGVFLPVTNSFTDSWSIGGTPPPPGELSVNFNYAPSNPAPGDTITFTAVVSGGAAPYTYNWNLAGQTATGSTVTRSFAVAGTYSIQLTASDAESRTASTTKSVTVSSGGPPPPGAAPQIIGWGGVRLDEAAIGGGILLPPTSTPSVVFAGEPATNMELLVIRMTGLGYNGVRVSFNPMCGEGDQYMSDFNMATLTRAVQIAQYFDFWLIIDYHAYTDPVFSESCWLSSWSPITQQFVTGYGKIIWEPWNEPFGFPGGDDVATLSGSYQKWINQVRTQGDTHWIVVQNLCSFACGFANYADGYPTVTDSVGKIFISLHSYMGYPYVGPWNNATAENYAYSFYNAVLDGMTRTGWPAFNTEGGADWLCGEHTTVSCVGVNSSTNTPPPDLVVSGSAGYTKVTFHFMQFLTNLYDAHTPQRIGWMWWPAGSWTDTPGAGIYGTLQCDTAPIGWGCLLQYNVIGVGPPPIERIPPLYLLLIVVIPAIITVSLLLKKKSRTKIRNLNPIRRY